MSPQSLCRKMRRCGISVSPEVQEAMREQLRQRRRAKSGWYQDPDGKWRKPCSDVATAIRRSKWRAQKVRK